MAHIRKIYKIIIEREPREIIESKLDEWQNGFRPNIPTTNC